MKEEPEIDYCLTCDDYTITVIKVDSQNKNHHCCKRCGQ